MSCQRGTRAFSSSNQFKTTRISSCGGAPLACPGVTRPRILPSGMMSNARRDPGGPPWNTRVTLSGLPKLTVGCVDTPTRAIMPGSGIYVSALPSGDQTGWCGEVVLAFTSTYLEPAGNGCTKRLLGHVGLTGRGLRQPLRPARAVDGLRENREVAVPRRLKRYSPAIGRPHRRVAVAAERNSVQRGRAVTIRHADEGLLPVLAFEGE